MLTETVTNRLEKKTYQLSGNLQLIIFLGILYVVAADELIDSHLIVLNERVSQVMRVLLLPSYVGITLLAIFMIIP